MNSPAEDIKDMLVAESSLGLDFQTDGTGNLYIGKEPGKPNDCITIFDTPGAPPQLTLRRGEEYHYPSVQIRVRNTKYEVGWALIQDIQTALHSRAQEVWNGVLYSVIYCSSGPFHLDWDDNNRARFIINFNIQRR